MIRYENQNYWENNKATFVLYLKYIQPYYFTVLKKHNEALSVQGNAESTNIIYLLLRIGTQMFLPLGFLCTWKGFPSRIFILYIFLDNNLLRSSFSFPYLSFY